MSGKDKTEFPPLLEPGFHPVSMERVRELCVTDFPYSRSRPEIMKGVEEVVRRLLAAKVPGELWIDGSFLTKKDEPDDADLLWCGEAEPYNNGTPEQKAVMRWFDEDDLRTPYRCDSRLSLIHPVGHIFHQDDLSVREYWRKRFGEGRGVRKGLAVVQT